MQWTKTKLGDFAPFIYGKGLPQAKRKRGEVPVYGSNGIVGTHSEPFVTEPAVIIGRKGSVGEVHLANGPSWPIDTAFYALGSTEVDLHYLYYLLKTLPITSNSDSAVPGLNRDSAHSLEICVPDIQGQTAIGKILFSLDQKIEANNALSKTLEDIAQTIFKCWFIDFGPVKAKMAGEKPVGLDATTATLFPDSMEESEIGLIPKGWEVKTLGDICATTIGGLWGNDDESPENPDSYQCIRGVDMDDLKASGYAPRVPVRWDKTNNFSKRLLSGTQILIAGSGAGPVAKSLLWDEAMNNLFSQPVVFSNFVKRFECNSNEMASFVSSILSTMYESREIFTFVNGTSVPNLQDKELLTGKKVAVPSIDLLGAFDNIKRTSIKRKFSGENSNLVAIRDSLLPRLISGELQIPEEMLAS
jgi:type I restriction enzyme S subunit